MSSTKNKHLAIDEQMTSIVEEIISESGFSYEISRNELIDKVVARFATNRTSIIPADFCYNRVNKGINFEAKPRLLKFWGNGQYECLGASYRFTGKVYTKPKDKSIEIEVGSWQDGKFKKNENWKKLGLK